MCIAWSLPGQVHCNQMCCGAVLGRNRTSQGSVPTFCAAVCCPPSTDIATLPCCRGRAGCVCRPDAQLPQVGHAEVCSVALAAGEEPAPAAEVPEVADPALVLKRFREEGCSVRLLHPQRCVQHDLFLASRRCCEGGVPV